MKRMWVCAVGVVVMLVFGATRAAAQSSMDSFHGYLTGQAAWANGGDVTSPVFMPGFSVAVQESNGWGAEFDFGYGADTDAGTQQLDVASYMFSASWIQRRGRVRPLAVLGLGIMQIDGCTACNHPSKTYDMGFNGGGGLVFLLNDTVAVRGDVRYFQSFADHPDLQRPDGFGYFRYSVGLTFLWAIAP
jgi:opacity protein-like surface antigen